MGSIQANRVPKGKRLPGHMGHETITIQKLEVIRVDAERNVILVKGSIPGPKNGFVKVKQTVKN
jgi:large subunit ribosomal protein L3